MDFKNRKQSNSVGLRIQPRPGDTGLAQRPSHPVGPCQGHAVRRHGGAPAEDAAVVGVRVALHSDHQRSEGVASGEARMVGAHREGCRW
jgi:hypothetical protein